MDKQFTINMIGAVSGAVIVGIGLAGAISGGIAIGSALLLIGGSGTTGKNVSTIQSYTDVLDDRLLLFAVVMTIISIITAIGYVPLMR